MMVCEAQRQLFSVVVVAAAAAVNIHPHAIQYIISVNFEHEHAHRTDKFIIIRKSCIAKLKVKVNKNYI